MGVFQELVEVVNRTSKPLAIMFDGQRKVLEPNYDAAGKRIERVRNMVPSQVLPYALNQTIIMGSEDIRNPGNFQSLVGVPSEKKRSWRDCSYHEQSDELTRVPMAAVIEDDPTIKGYKVRGKKQHSTFDQTEGLTGVATPFEPRVNA